MAHAQDFSASFQTLNSPVSWQKVMFLCSLVTSRVSLSFCLRRWLPAFLSLPQQLQLGLISFHLSEMDGSSSRETSMRSLRQCDSAARIAIALPRWAPTRAEPPNESAGTRMGTDGWRYYRPLQARPSY